MAEQKFSVAIKSEGYQRLINDTLGDKELARQFVADISTAVSQNSLLANCDAGSILSAGLVAQSMKLPITSSLGFAYLVPYGNKCQFQMGWKGLIQLAQRSGQFERLGVREVHKGEYIGQDEFGDDQFKFSHDFDNNEVVGYYAYFKLLNGFIKTMYWTKEQCEAHAKKYSKSYASTSSTNLWRDNFNLMGSKTVLKLLLNRYAPLSVEMQNAIKVDQAIYNSDGTYDYLDNPQNDKQVKKTQVTNTIPTDENGVVKEKENNDPITLDEEILFGN